MMDKERLDDTKALPEDYLRLTAANVDAIMGKCLDGASDIVVDGVINKFGFSQAQLAIHQESINQLLEQLPAPFHQKTGGGWSFLEACVDRDGDMWTSLHLKMEALFALGMGIGRVECQMPREVWGVLPGGVPYYIIKELKETE